jgi:hypothetical protein
MNPHPKNNKLQQTIKSELKRADQIHLDLDDRFFDQLHDRIMSQVVAKKIEPPPPPPPPLQKLKKFVWSKPWRQIFLSHETFAIFVLIFGLTYQSAQSSLYNSWMRYQAREENILEQAMKSPDLLQNLTDARPQNDFFVDVANHSMNDFEYDHLKNSLWNSAESETKSQ